MTPDRLRLAVPNKGRMLEPTLRLLRDAGLEFEDQSRALVSHAEQVPLDILHVRTEDIVELVTDGIADLGITGTNLLAEADADLPIRLELGYGRCRLEAAVPTGDAALTVADLAGRRIATSHPVTTRRFFATQGTEVEIVSLSGSVEVAPRLGLAEAIVDLVSTGSTLVANGLRSVGSLLESQALLVSRPQAIARADTTVDEVITMLGAVVAGRRRKYLMMNAPRVALPAIEAILPGLASPSVIPLASNEMVAVHAVVADAEVWRMLPSLRAAGASGILVMPIEKLVP
jgi:ATP phosphoribosyltransferase